MARVSVPPWLQTKLAAAKVQAHSLKAEANANYQANPNRKWAILLLALWIVAGIFTIVIPGGHFAANRAKYYNYYGRYIAYENQQRQYEQQNNNNNNGYYYTYPECSWYQWSCRKQQYYYRQQNGGGGGDNNQIYTPNWYRFIGGREGEEDERFYEEMGIAQPEDPSATGAVKFVHTWTQVLFVGLLLYGAGIIMLGRPINGLVVCMIFFFQFSLLNLILLGQGVIRTDGRDLENSVYGWSGQLPILMVYTDFAYVVFCLFWCLFFFLRYAILFFMAKHAARSGGASEIAEKDPNEEYTTPEVYKTLDNHTTGTSTKSLNTGYNAMA